MLQYFTPDILRTLSGQQSGYIIGEHMPLGCSDIRPLIHVKFIDFHRVFVSYARSIKGPIYLNTQVTKIGTYVFSQCLFERYNHTFW